MAQSNAPKLRDHLIYRWARELLSILLWLYFIIKLFVFDFDNYVFNTYFHSVSHLLYYKFFLVTFFIFSLWIIFHKFNFFLVIVYIVMYPLNVVFWKLPKYFYRDWLFAFILLSFLRDVLSSFKKYVIRNVLCALAIVLILSISNKYILIISTIVLGYYLLHHLYKSFAKAYRSNALMGFKKVMRLIIDRLRDDPSLLDGSLEDKHADPGLKEPENSTRNSILKMYFFHGIGVAIKERVHQIAKSRRIDLFLIAAWFWTVFLTVILFSFEYYAIFKINPAAFSSPSEITYLSFVSFSFEKLTHAQISMVLPISVYAKITCYIEHTYSIMIFIILLFTILTAARERYKEELDSIVEMSTELVSLIEERFTKTFDMLLDEAEKVLMNDNSAIVNFIRKLKGLQELPEPPEDPS